MTRARRIVPGQTVFITSRAVGRTFRFVPEDRVVQSLAYCFAVAVKKYDVLVHEVVYMSNHLHIVATFLDDELPSFMQYLNSLTSRQLNALRGRSGANFESHFNCVDIGDPEKVLEHCAYTQANPCAADLVTRADKWRGFTSARMAYGVPVVLERPKCGLWKPSRMNEERRQDAKAERQQKSAGRRRRRGRVVTPDRVELTLSRPPGFESMTAEALRDEVRRRVVVLEDQAERARRAEGRRVLGMRRVKAQHWSSYPERTESMFGPVPRASGSNKWARMERLQADGEFQASYRRARAAFVGGERDVEFPAGTWQMRRRFNVCCACPPT